MGVVRGKTSWLVSCSWNTYVLLLNQVISFTSLICSKATYFLGFLEGVPYALTTVCSSQIPQLHLVCAKVLGYKKAIYVLVTTPDSDWGVDKYYNGLFCMTGRPKVGKVRRYSPDLSLNHKSQMEGLWRLYYISILLAGQLGTF